MKFDDRYELRVAVVNLHDSIMVGDCYDDFRKLKEEHPHDSWQFVYLIVDTETGFVPEECEDWYDTPDEAWFEYEKLFG